MQLAHINRLFRHIFIVALTVVTALVSGQETAMANDDNTESRMFIVLYAPGPAWEAGKSVMEQALRPHGLYIKSLRDNGSLMAAGPLMEQNGGIAILRAPSLSEAEKILAADPGVTSGIFTASVQSWIVTFAEGDFPVTPVYR